LDLEGGSNNRLEKLHNEAIYNLYMTHIGEVRYSHKIVIRKPEGKRYVKRPRRRWKDNIKKYLKEIR
jgi:hypothetical protein